jgi:hypothetical protein
VGHVACTEELRNAYNIVQKPEGKRLLSGWEDNIKVHLTELCCGAFILLR